MPEMLNYWYVAKPNELLIDMDKPERSYGHFAKRLAGAIECEKFKIQSYEFHHSRSGSHLHFLITLESAFLCEIERVVWEVVLHSDIYKGCATLMRLIHAVDAADLLITPFPFKRKADDICTCVAKHSAEIMKNCPAAIRLRGDDRIRGFFGIPSKKKLEDITDLFHKKTCNSVTGLKAKSDNPVKNS
jgi:hypothetical protein